ncbi:MAG: hypothetical protein IKN57_11855 [Parasporobacterium sp.]|nr:hypothetical protein [Parasporobacterium sp.]MBR3644189.1 hypothetical protein [Parasporobacterium sp.]
MATNKELYDARLNRVKKAVAMEKPDRVPVVPFFQTFPYLWAGYTIAECFYDVEKAKDAYRRFLNHFQPDMAMGYSGVFLGQGPIMEKMDAKQFQWPGQPGGKVDPRNIFQYIEKPYLAEGEYPELLSDLSGWYMNKWLPRVYGALDGLKSFSIPLMSAYSIPAGMVQFANPQIVEIAQNLHEVGKLSAAWLADVAAFEQEMMDMGYPIWAGAATTTAFDVLSDTLRGTIDTMADLFENPEEVHRAVEMFYPTSFYGGVAQMQHANGLFVFIPLHKGLDGFMSPKQYDEFYWPTLQRMVEGFIQMGYTPLIYTEGKYDSRLERIKEITPGKCLYHFEDVDIKEAKRIVGKDHCISGGLSSQVLRLGKPDQVRDAVKELFDICAVDGGYIFDLSDTIDDVPVENVEAMMETAFEYGKY